MSALVQDDAPSGDLPPDESEQPRLNLAEPAPGSENPHREETKGSPRSGDELANHEELHLSMEEGPGASAVGDSKIPN